MKRDYLKEEQPIAFRILENALVNNKVAHAYLFVGAKGTLKKETALWFAQSILCEQELLACEQCDLCQRVEKFAYADLIFLDGAETSIKKEDILHIQEEFTKTAIERSGKKIYIINQIENATTSSLNTLLKFLEEPSSDVIAMLLCEQVDALLPTIVSRCQNIPFVKAKPIKSYQKLIEANVNELDAYLLSHLVGNTKEAIEKNEDENYQAARIIVFDSLRYLQESVFEMLYYLQKESFKEKKGNDRIQFRLAMQIYAIFFKDAITKTTNCKSEAYQQLLPVFSDKAAAYLKCCVQAQDRCNKVNNIALLVDQFVKEIKEA